MLEVVYPAESFFYPYHLITALITGALFFVIVLVLHVITVKSKSSVAEPATAKPASINDTVTYKQDTHSSDITKSSKALDINKIAIPFCHSLGLKLSRSDLDNRESTEKASLADSIALAGLFITLIVTGIYPFIQNPLLDYTVKYIGNNKSDSIQKFSIEVSNWGLASAKNAIFSMQSDNVKFLKFHLQPFLSNYSKQNTSLKGYGFFEIAVIPPRSDTTIYAELDTSNATSNQRLKTFVRSDERVGYHDTPITIIFYLALGVAYIVLFLWMVFKKKLENIRRRHIPWYLLTVVAYIVIFTLIYTQIYGRP